jgi:histidinol phosphatase-like enzyme (inositol monophosphatase family)
VTSAERNEDVELALRLVDAAAQFILPYFRCLETVENKLSAGFDPVTVADKGGEQAIRTMLQTERPDDGILGEELGYRPGTSGSTWVLDPIDGTRAFISGLPTWGTLVGLYDGHRARVGVMNQPFVGERFVGSPEGAFCLRSSKKTPLRVRNVETLEQATLCATDPAMFRPGPEANAFRAVAEQCRLTRFGTDCYAYCLLAMGQVDLVIEANVQAYDVQALIPIVEAAGGIFTTWAGDDPHAGGQVIAAANPRLHELALRHLNGAIQPAPKLPAAMRRP